MAAATVKSGTPQAKTGHREALLEGAIRCIQEKGFADTTARDIVAASGTNLASTGYHYGSKDKLLQAALAEAFQRWLAQLAAVAFEEPAAPAIERLRKSLTAWSETFEENRPFMVAFVEALAQSAHAPELREQIAEQYRLVRATVAAMVEDICAAEPGGSESEIDATAIASVLIALTDGLMLQWFLEPERKIDGAELLRAVEDATALISAGKL